MRRPFFTRDRASDDTAITSTTPSSHPHHPDLSKAQLKRATRTRKIWALLTSFLLFVTVVFLILVEIAGVKNKAIINEWYFIRFDFSNVVPSSVPNFALINTIAQTLGLHDFYQVGLWGFCEGYKSEGVTFCSRPETLYWFNPVEIIRNELLAGASINLPAEINNILSLIKLASQWMFGLFLTSACLSTLLIPLTPLSLFTRWLTLPVALFTLLNALLATAASVIATVMFIIFKNTITSIEELNIGAELGVSVFVFMWIASAGAILAAVGQVGLLCCCASRRDVRKGRKRGSEKAYEGSGAAGGVGVVAGEGREKKRFWQRR